MKKPFLTRASARVPTTRSLALVLSLWTASCGATAVLEREGERVARVPLLGAQTFPEGIAFHPGTGELFVGGLAHGEIQRVTAAGVDYFKHSHEDGLQNVVGLAVDPARDRLWVCSTSFAEPTIPPSLLVFDTRTGEARARLTIPADSSPHFLNDVDVDAEGNAYATDSLAPVIWRVTADLARIEAWATSPAFTLDPSGFNLNGLVLAGGGRFIITSVPSASGQGKLFRIALTDRSVQEIRLRPAFPGADGMVMLSDHRLLAASGPSGLFSLELDREFTEARVVPMRRFAAELDLPTTVAVADGRLWIVNSQLDHFVVAAFGDRGPPTLPFEIVGLPLQEL